MLKNIVDKLPIIHKIGFLGLVIIACVALYGGIILYQYIKKEGK